MIRVTLVLLVLAIASAIGAWILPEGLVESLLKVCVAAIGLILVFIAFIGVLQWISPAEAEDETRPR